MCGHASYSRILVERHSENSPIAGPLGKIRGLRPSSPQLNTQLSPPQVTLYVFISVCYSLSEQKKSRRGLQNPKHHPVLTPVLRCYLQTLSSPDCPQRSRRCQPIGPHSTTHYPSRSANLRLSDHVSQGRYTYNLSGFLISPKKRM